MAHSLISDRFSPMHEATVTSESLVVADMGLDFRSYHMHHGNETKSLTNLAEFKLIDLLNSFEVTAGVLFHCLRQYWKAPPLEAKLLWLSMYAEFELEYAQLKPSGDTAKSTVDYIASLDVNPQNFNYVLQELCARFDAQFPPKNAETTWDRIRKNSVQAAFCNIHTSGRKCDAKYCNQLHLRNINEETNHRFYFYKALVELLQSEGATEADIQYRLDDAIFFARHGNECTVRCEGKNVAFFDTMFTYGRLKHACRRSNDECHNPLCKSEDCPGVHLRKRNGVGTKERRELAIQRVGEVMEDVQKTASHMFQLIKQMQQSTQTGRETYSRSSSTHSSITSTMNRYNAENQAEDEEDELNPVPLYL